MKHFRRRPRFLIASIVVCVVGAVLPALPAAAAEIPIRRAAADRVLADRYLVRVSPTADPQQVAEALGVTPRGTWRTGTVRGFAATLSPDRLSAAQHRGDVVAIEEDQRITVDPLQEQPAEAAVAPGVPAPATTATGSSVPTPSWGIDRINQRTLPLDNRFDTAYPGATRVYVIDTGIDTNHPEFGGRASTAWTAYPNLAPDCHGHGTFVAGVVGGAHVGISRISQLKAVRVLDCAGHGSASDLVLALSWLWALADPVSVVNMSVNYGDSWEVQVNTAELALKMPVAVSAGNDDEDTCDDAPANASFAITTAASTIHDKPWSDTDFGPCVELYAPGHDVTSAWLGGTYKTASGTSAAAPHVAGVIARKGSANSASQIRQWLLDDATKNVIQENKPGTPNLLLHIGLGPAAPDPNQVLGYVYADKLSTAGPYQPSAQFQRNSANQVNTVRRTGVGAYEVRMPGLGGAGGVAHVDATNTKAAWCKLGGFGRSAADELIHVRCYDAAGQPLDARFGAVYTRSPAGLSGAFAYLRSGMRHDPGQPDPAAFNYNSMGGLNTVTRLAGGTYRVDLPDVGVTGGTVLVTAEGPGTDTCTAADWDTVGTAEQVLVSCFDLTGTRADSPFTLTFSDSRSIVGTLGPRAHLWMSAFGATQPVYVPTAPWTFNSVNGVNRVERDGPGDYDVILPGMAGSTRGHVQVRAQDDSTRRCQPAMWWQEGLDLRVHVSCSDLSGAPADAALTLQYAW